jgi:hypothetical protein
MADCTADIYNINYLTDYSNPLTISVNGSSQTGIETISSDPIYSSWPLLISEDESGTISIESIDQLSDYLSLEGDNVPNFQTENQCSFEDTNSFTFETDSHNCYLNVNCDTSASPAVKEYDYTCSQKEPPIFEWMNYNSSCDTWDYCPDDDDNYSCLVGGNPNIPSNGVDIIICGENYQSISLDGDIYTQGPVICQDNKISFDSPGLTWSGQCHSKTCDPLSIHNSDREFDVVIDDVREGGEESVRCNDGYAFSHGVHHQGGNVSCEITSEGGKDWFIYDSYLDGLCSEGDQQTCDDIRFPSHIHETNSDLNCDEYIDSSSCPPKYCYWNEDSSVCQEKHIGCQWIESMNECKFRVNVSNNEDYPICEPQYCPRKSVSYSDRIESAGFHPLPGPEHGHHTGKCVHFEDAIEAQRLGDSNTLRYSNNDLIDSSEDCMCIQHKSCSTCNESENCQWCTGEGADGLSGEQNGICMSIHTSDPKCDDSVRQDGPGSCKHHDGSDKDPWFPMNEIGCEEYVCKDKNGNDVPDFLLAQLTPNSDPMERCLSRNNQWNNHPVTSSSSGVCHYINEYNDSNDNSFYPTGSISENISIREKICKSKAGITTIDPITGESIEGDPSCSTSSDISSCLTNDNCEWIDNPIKQSTMRWTDQFNYIDVVRFNNNVQNSKVCKKCVNTSNNSVVITDKDSCEELGEDYQGGNVTDLNEIGFHDIYSVNINDDIINLSPITNNDPNNVQGGYVTFEISDIESPCLLSTETHQYYYGVPPEQDPILLNNIKYNTNLNECQYLANDDSLGVLPVSENSWCFDGRITCDPQPPSVVGDESICLPSGTAPINGECPNEVWPGCQNPRCSNPLSDKYSNCFIPEEQLDVGGDSEEANCSNKNLPYSVQELDDYTKYENSNHNIIHCGLSQGQNYITPENIACSFIGNQDDDVYYTKFCVNNETMEYASLNEACISEGGLYEYDNDSQDWKCYDSVGTELDSASVCQEVYGSGDSQWTLSTYNKCLLDSSTRDETDLNTQCSVSNNHKIRFNYELNTSELNTNIINQGVCENTNGGFEDGYCGFDNTLCSDIQTSAECTRENFSFNTDYTFSDESYCDSSLNFGPDEYYHWTGGTIHGGEGENWESDCSSTLLSSCNVQCDDGYGGGGDYVCHYNNDSEEICNEINESDEFKDSSSLDDQTSLCERHLNCIYSIDDPSDLETATCSIRPTECDGFQDSESCNDHSECTWNEENSTCGLTYPIRGNLEWIGSECYRLDNTSFSHGISNFPDINEWFKPFMRVIVFILFLIIILLLLSKTGILKGGARLSLVFIRKLIVGFATGITNLFRDLIIGIIKGVTLLGKGLISLTKNGIPAGLSAFSTLYKLTTKLNAIMAFIAILITIIIIGVSLYSS